MTTKVVLIGICAGDKDLLTEWAEAGVLPGFRSLLARGYVGWTENLPGFYVGSTWMSLMTGANPAETGIYSWQQLAPGSYQTYRCKAGEYSSRQPFWDRLSEAGRRVAVLDVPHSWPSADLNGVQLVEWGAHDANFGFLTSPPELADEIIAKYGHHPQRGNCNARRDAAGYLAFRDGLVHGIETKLRITKDIYCREPWDFFAQVFTEAHCAGHQCWHLHDTAHPRHDPSIAAVTGDPVRDVYVAIDQAIAELLAEIDRDTTVIVLASHGMGAKYSGQFLLDKILVALGVAAPAPASAPRPKRRQQIDPLLTWGWQRLPPSVRGVLQPVRRGMRHWIDGDRSPPKTIDEPASQCFIVENNPSHGAIRVNLVGREPDGKVEPGEAFEAFLADLEVDLAGIVNLETGRPIVDRVIRTSDVYRGDQLASLPDLLIEWSPDSPVRAIGSNKIGRIEGIEPHVRTGDHRPGGMFIAYGPGIEPGRLEHAVSILDIAPTIARLLGVELTDVDGSPIAELLGGMANTVPTESNPA